MKPVILVLFATICYAIANSILETRLSKYNPLSLMICYLPIVLTCAVLARVFTKVENPSFDFPTGSAVAAVVILGVVYSVADYLYIGSYAVGGSSITITSVLTTMPIFVSVIKLLSDGKLPNKWQIGSYVLICIALALMAKGSAVTTTK
jgi:drug/metabolite transporter (DMT)-like permease